MIDGRPPASSQSPTPPTCTDILHSHRCNPMHLLNSRLKIRRRPASGNAQTATFRCHHSTIGGRMTAPPIVVWAADQLPRVSSWPEQPRPAARRCIVWWRAIPALRPNPVPVVVLEQCRTVATAAAAAPLRGGGGGGVEEGVGVESEQPLVLATGAVPD